jgi:hypothetical protein
MISELLIMVQDSIYRQPGLTASLFEEQLSNHGSQYGTLTSLVENVEAGWFYSMVGANNTCSASLHSTLADTRCRSTRNWQDVHG